LTGWLARSGLPLELVALGHKVVTVVMVGVTWRLVRIQKKGSELIDWTLVIVMMLVVNNLSWQHHLVWLLLPMMVLVKWVKEEKSWSGLALLGVVYLLVAGNVKNPEVYTGWRRWGLSHGFYGVVLVYGWLAKWKVSSD